jgi:hypothetical protein
MFDIGSESKIAAGSHSHYFVFNTMRCIVPLGKLWERHPAAINK